MSDELVETYLETLGHLSLVDIEIAFPEALRRETSGYMPTPGQILGALAALHDKFGAQIPNAHAHCKKCGGTGFITIAARDPLTNQEIGDGYRWAVRCTEPQNALHIHEPVYRWQDCKEGRAFMANFANLAGKTPEQTAEVFKKRIEDGDGL
jgi:hypothetical protein